MSAGLILPIDPPIYPSITYNGSLDPVIELVPRDPDTQGISRHPVGTLYRDTGRSTLKCLFHFYQRPGAHFHRVLPY